MLLNDKKLYKRFSEHGKKNIERFTILEQVKAFDKMIDSLK